MFSRPEPHTRCVAFHLTESQFKDLQNAADDAGVSMSHMVRRGLLLDGIVQPPRRKAVMPKPKVTK